MNLIERYINEVGRRLPRKQRDDVQKELRSTLQDALDDRLKDAATEGTATAETTEAATVDLLREFGPPRRLAASYVGARYLIGPDAYPAFVTTVQWVLGIVLGLVLVGWILANGLPGSPRELVYDFARLLNELWNAGLGLLGLIVVIFVVVQRLGERDPYADGLGVGAVTDGSGISGTVDTPASVADWDPRKLPAIPDRDRLDRTEEIIGLCFVAIGLVMFNFLPEKIGAYVTVNGDGGWIPLFGASLRDHLPLLNVVFGGWMLLGLALLRLGRWNLWLRLADLLLMIGCVVLIRGAMADPDLMHFDAAWFSQHGMDTASAEGLADDVAPVLTVIFRVGFWLLLAGSLWSVLAKTWRLVRGLRV